VPAAYVSLAFLPRTPNGKVDRRALPAPGDQAFGTEAYEAPRGPIETVIGRIWSEFLHLERVGRHDDFFDVGGHSLIALRVIGEINKSLKARLHVPAFFQNPTIERLAKVVGQKHHLVHEHKVIELQFGRTGLPLYFLGAGPLEYSLAQYIGGDRAIFAIDLSIWAEWRHAITVKKPMELQTMEQLGALYSDVLREHAGSSPVVIAGYSFQGKMAFEAAHALQRAGGNVGLVLLLDSRVRSGLFRGVGWDSFQLIWRGTASRKASNTPSMDSLSASLRHSWRLFRWLLPRVPPLVKLRLQRTARLSGFFDEDGVPIEQTVVDRLTRKARRSWRVQPLDASGVLIRSQVPGEGPPGYDLANGWGDLFDRGLEIVEATGDHNSIVAEENRPALARLINNIIDRYEPAHNPGVVTSDETDVLRSAGQPKSGQELSRAKQAAM
jgi:thioesterase domain-containing protein